MYAVDVSAPPTIVWRRQVGKLSCYAVAGYVETIAGNRAIARTVIGSCAGSAAEKIHAVARQTCDIVGAADNAQRNIGDVIIGPPAVGKSGLNRRRARRDAFGFPVGSAPLADSNVTTRRTDGRKRRRSRIAPDT